jgi:hypothetical protein
MQAPTIPGANGVPCAAPEADLKRHSRIFNTNIR